MLIGIAYALAAGMMWGLVFVSPLLLPEYPPALQSVGRYLAFGMIVITGLANLVYLVLRARAERWIK